MENRPKTPRPLPFPAYLQGRMDEANRAYDFFLLAGQHKIRAIRWNTFVANRAGNEEAANRWALL